MNTNHYDSFVLHRQLLLQLGDRLRRLRKTQKLTMAETAKRAGISRMTLAAVEAGDPGPSIGTYLGVMGVLGVAADLAFLSGDMVHTALHGTAAARTHRPTPQVQIVVHAESAHHKIQDLQSLVLHEKAVERMRAEPHLIDEAKATVKHWRERGNTRSHTLFAEWEHILTEKKWSKVLGSSRHAQELRQASPLPSLLSKEERECILRDIGMLKKGVSIGLSQP